ncbi:hypothetical protein Tco_0748565 [Tanacetum coccineum]|uniref:Transmembrane protein n=1 Tax=Tanacetum coccineum TaxID=301880 RepID=A0ABQ4YVZ3_9ASTR
MFLAPTVSSLMAYFVAILTPNSARSCVMQSTLPTKGMRSIISTVSIILKDFMIFYFAVDVIVVAIIGVVVFVMIIGIVVVVGGVPSIIKLSFVIIGWACAFHQDKASSVKVPVANVTLFSSAHLLHENTDSVRVPVRLLGLLALAMATVCASMAVVRSAISCRMTSKVCPWFSDLRLVGGILSTSENRYSSGTKKYQGSNSSDCGNTGDGVKIAGEVIGSDDEIEFSEVLKELLPDEARK